MEVSGNEEVDSGGAAAAYRVQAEEVDGGRELGSHVFWAVGRGHSQGPRRWWRGGGATTEMVAGAGFGPFFFFNQTFANGFATTFRLKSNL